jgi:hypothetical protein
VDKYTVSASTCSHWAHGFQTLSALIGEPDHNIETCQEALAVLMTEPST